jgi:acyl carrier protein
MSPPTIRVDDVASFVAARLGKRLPAGTVLDGTTNLETIGLSSLDLTEIYFQIEETVGVELDPAEASNVRTIGDLVEVVNRLVMQAGTSQPTTVEHLR